MRCRAPPPRCVPRVGRSLNPLAFPQTEHPLAAQWNGSSWTFRPVPLPSGITYASLDAVSCPTASHCIAVGSYATPTSAATLPLTERWDGTRWTIEPVPVASGTYATALSAVSCVSTTRCTAVGHSYATYSAPATPLAETWDGSTWAPQPVPGSPADSSLAGISCRAATDCVAVGASHVTTQRNTALAARLTVSGWHVEATAAPAADRTLASVSCTSNGCHAVGWTLTDASNVVYSALAERHP